MKKFVLGKTVMTRGVAELIKKDFDAYWKVTECLYRHESGDWGDLCEEDKKANDYAVEHGERLLSSYHVLGEKIWIITEWNRSVTTILLPEEY